jgi:hypothetical protein
MGVILIPVACWPVSGQTAVSELLHRQTQELYDALAPGKVSVWERYLDQDARYPPKMDWSSRSSG